MKLRFLAVSAAFLVTPAMAGESAWQGAYIGVSAGNGMGQTKADFADGVLVLDGLGSVGNSVGGLIGFNHLASDKVLFGLEARGEYTNVESHIDISAVSEDVNVDDANPGIESLSVDAKAELDWSATATSRFGLLVSPSTLLYSALGATVVHGSGRYYTEVDGEVEADRSEEDLFYGVAFAAVGAETQLAGNARVRFEYSASFLEANLYESGTPIKITPTVGTARLSLIYGFGGASQAADTGTADVSWTGVYIGGAGGRNHSVSEYSVGENNSELSFSGFGAEGWSGSIVGGYNHQMGERLVVGAEISATSSSSKDRYLYLGQGILGENSSWAGGRIRAGYLFAPGTMGYGFAGYSRVKSELHEIGYTSMEYKRDALEFGGGIETFVSEKVSVRAEYSYAMLEEVELMEGFNAGTLDMDQATGTVAVLFHF